MLCTCWAGLWGGVKKLCNQAVNIEWYPLEPIMDDEIELQDAAAYQLDLQASIENLVNYLRALQSKENNKGKQSKEESKKRSKLIHVLLEMLEFVSKNEVAQLSLEALFILTYFVFIYIEKRAQQYTAIPIHEIKDFFEKVIVSPQLDTFQADMMEKFMGGQAQEQEFLRVLKRVKDGLLEVDDVNPQSRADLFTAVVHHLLEYKNRQIAEVSSASNTLTYGDF